MSLENLQPMPVDETDQISWEDVGLSEWATSEGTEITLAGLDEVELVSSQLTDEPTIDSSLSDLYSQATAYESTMIDLEIFADQMALYACMYHDHSGGMHMSGMEQMFDVSEQPIAGGLGEHFGKPCHACTIGTIGANNKCTHCGHDESHHH